MIVLMRTRFSFAILLVLLVGCSSAVPPGEPKPVQTPVVEPVTPAPAVPGPLASAAKPAGSGSAGMTTEPEERPWLLERQLAGEFGGGPKTLVLWRREPNPEYPFVWKEQLRLEVHEGGAEGALLAQTLVDGTKVVGFDLLPGEPAAIILRYRQESISDHSAGVEFYAWEGNTLVRKGTRIGWYGWTDLVQGPEGPEVIVAEYYTPTFATDYYVDELNSKPAPRMIRKERLQWKGGKVESLGQTYTRLAYRIYNETKPFEEPLHPDALKAYEEATRKIEQQDWVGAVERLGAALKLTPDYPVALTALAHATFEQGAYREAEQSAAEAASLNPWIGEAHYWLGRARLAQGDAKGAQRALWVACARLSRDPKAHRYLGEAFEGLGERVKAATEYKRALELAPGVPEVEAALLRVR